MWVAKDYEEVRVTETYRKTQQGPCKRHTDSETQGEIHME